MGWHAFESPFKHVHSFGIEAMLPNALCCPAPALVLPALNPFFLYRSPLPHFCLQSMPSPPMPSCLPCPCTLSLPHLPLQTTITAMGCWTSCLAPATTTLMVSLSGGIIVRGKASCKLPSWCAAPWPLGPLSPLNPPSLDPAVVC